MALVAVAERDCPALVAVAVALLQAITRASQFQVAQRAFLLLSGLAERAGNQTQQKASPPLVKMEGMVQLRHSEPSLLLREG